MEGKMKRGRPKKRWVSDVAHWMVRLCGVQKERHNIEFEVAANEVG